MEATKAARLSIATCLAPSLRLHSSHHSLYISYICNMHCSHVPQSTTYTCTRLYVCVALCRTGHFVFMFMFQPEYFGRTNSWLSDPAFWKSGASPLHRDTSSPSCIIVLTQLLTVKQLVSRQSRAL